MAKTKATTVPKSKTPEKLQDELSKLKAGEKQQVIDKAVEETPKGKLDYAAVPPLEKEESKVSSNGYAAKKTKCDITRSRFRDRAVAMVVVVDGQQKVVPVKEFSTGSFGWYGSDKVDVKVDGVSLKVQMTVQMVIANSKEAAD